MLFCILKNVANQTVACMEKKIYKSQLFGYRHSSKNLLLCSKEKKKFIKVWNNLRVSIELTFLGELSG